MVPGPDEIDLWQPGMSPASFVYSQLQYLLGSENGGPIFWQLNRDEFPILVMGISNEGAIESGAADIYQLNQHLSLDTLFDGEIRYARALVPAPASV